MIICHSTDYVPEKYSDYRNRTVTKHIDKIKNQLMQIKQCSLKGDDKNKLKQELLKLIQES